MTDRDSRDQSIMRKEKDSASVSRAIFDSRGVSCVIEWCGVISVRREIFHGFPWGFLMLNTTSSVAMLTALAWLANRSHREKERLWEERLEHFGSLAINSAVRRRRKYIIRICTYIYTIGLHTCLVRPMPNYHILILGLNGGLLVKHKKNTMLY